MPHWSVYHEFTLKEKNTVSSWSVIILFLLFWRALYVTEIRKDKLPNFIVMKWFNVNWIQHNNFQEHTLDIKALDTRFHLHRRYFQDKIFEFFLLICLSFLTFTNAITTLQLQWDCKTLQTWVSKILKREIT